MESYIVNSAPDAVILPAMQNTPIPPQAVEHYPKYTLPQAGIRAQTPVLSAGLLGLIVGATGAMGINLHKVSDGDMTLGSAAADSMVKGSKAGIATAAATAASNTLTSGGVVGLAVTLTMATGVIYLLNH